MNYSDDVDRPDLPVPTGKRDKATVLWHWNAEDLRHILKIHPDLFTFARAVNLGNPDQCLKRVLAVAGQPIEGSRDLLLTTAPVGQADRRAKNIALVITNTEDDSRKLEDSCLDWPCINLDIYEPKRGPNLTAGQDRRGSAAITFAYAAEDASDSIKTVVEAFGIAFGANYGAELLIFARRPVPVQSLIDDIRKARELGPIHLESIADPASSLASDTSAFDVLIVNEEADRPQLLLYEMAARGKEVAFVPSGGETADGKSDQPLVSDANAMDRSTASDASWGLAAEMLRAAKRMEDRSESVASRSTPVMRMRAPDRLARQLHWITRGPLGAIHGHGLRGIGWVTRWNAKCGIGDHAAQQIASYPGYHAVLAPREEPLVAGTESNVFRCWNLGLVSNDLENAAAVVFREQLAHVVIHFNWGFYNPQELHGFISSIRSGGRTAILDMHSTTSLRTEHGLRLADFTDCFDACDRVLVHQRADVERIKAVAPRAHLSIEPLGITFRDIARPKDNSARPLIASFGFCLPNKGIEELVLATWMLRQTNQDIRLLLLNAEHPAPDSRQTVEKIRNLIFELDLSDEVTFVTDFLDEAKCLKWLSEASLIVNPYQRTGESASAAVRFALASTAPVLVTPLPIFDDLGAAVFRAEGTSPAELAKAIRTSLAELNAGSRAALDVENAAANWREAHDLRVQSQRIFRVADNISRNRRAKDWLCVGAC